MMMDDDETDKNDDNEMVVDERRISTILFSKTNLINYLIHFMK